MKSVEMAEFMISLFAMCATVGAAIAALVSANVARASLREQSDNNKNAIKPFLAIDEKEFDLEFDSTKENYNLNWENGEHNLIDNTTFIGSYLDVVNISQGIAKNIKVKIVIDIKDSTIEKFNENLKGKGIRLSKRPYPKREDVQAINISGELNVVNGIKKFDRNYRLNCFPKQEFIFIGAEGDRKQLRLPAVFLVLHNLYVHYPQCIDFVELPSLLVTFNFEDIAGETYDLKYCVKSSSISIEERFNKNTCSKIRLAIKQI